MYSRWARKIKEPFKWRCRNKEAVFINIPLRGWLNNANNGRVFILTRK